MGKYIIIETKQPIEPLKSLILDIISEIIKIDQMVEDEHHLLMTYNHEIEVSLNEVITNLASDAFADLRLYESYDFNDAKTRDEHILFIKKLLPNISFQKHLYLNDVIILKTLLTQIEKSDYHFFLKDYINRPDLIKTVQIYLESNQNMSLAAKRLYIHRNTLIQRIDKFILVTGFDIRSFIPGYLIYYLITH